MRSLRDLLQTKAVRSPFWLRLRQRPLTVNRSVADVPWTYTQRVTVPDEGAIELAMEVSYKVYGMVRCF